MKIAVDAMGGDHSPEAVIAGVVEAIAEFKVNITLVGIEDQINAELNKYTFDRSMVEIVHAKEVVGMHEPATISLRQKKNSSITVGIGLLKEKKCDAFVSAGNTGAVVAASTVILRMLKGVDRPAIGLVIPTLKKFSFMIDVGANTDAKPEHLLQSALMANVYAREVLGIAEPKLGLINIGEEESKGTGFSKTTHKLMESRLPNFVGNIEANEVFKGRANCIICDGFIGNVVIKVSEGLMESAGTLLKREVKKSPLAMLGAFLMKKTLKHIRKYADYSEYGGAPLLGVNGLVMISHGRSDAKAIKNAIRATIQEVEHNIIVKMEEELNK